MTLTGIYLAGLCPAGLHSVGRSSLLVKVVTIVGR